MSSLVRGTASDQEWDEETETANVYRLKDSMGVAVQQAQQREQGVVNQLQSTIGGLFQTAQTHYQNAERGIVGGIESTINNLRALGQTGQTFPQGPAPDMFGRTDFGPSADTSVGLPEMPLTTAPADEQLDTSGFSPNAPGLAAEGIEGAGVTEWLGQGDPNAPSAFTALGEGIQGATDFSRTLSDQAPPMSTPRLATGAMQGVANMAKMVGGSADEIRRTAREGDTPGAAGNVLAGVGTAFSPGALLHGAAREVGVQDAYDVGGVPVPAANLAGLAGDVAMPATAMDKVIGALVSKGAKLTKELLSGTAEALRLDPAALLKRAAELGHSVVESAGEAGRAVAKGVDDLATATDKGMPRQGADRVYDALEGGSIPTRAAVDLGAGAAGAGASQVGLDEDTPLGERVARGAAGFAGGVAAAEGVRGAALPPPARAANVGRFERGQVTLPDPAALQKLRAMNQAKPPSQTAGRNMGAEIRERLTDEYAYLKDLEDAVVAKLPVVGASGETAYNKAIRYAGARGKVDAILRSDVAPTFQKLQQDGNKIDDLQTYLRASQVPELEAQGFKNPGGMTGQEATGALAQLAQDLGPQKYAALEARAQELYDFQGRILDQMQGGLLSTKSVADIKAKGQKYYPHLVMDLAEDAGTAYTSGRGGNLSVGASGVAKRKGSERAVMNPLEAIVSRAYSRLDRVERNDVAETIVRDVQTAFPAQVRKKKAGEVLSTGEGTVSYMKDGVKQDYVVPAPYAEVAKRLDDQQAGAFGKIAGAINSVSRAGFTAMNPDFIVRNLPRDAATAFYREGLFPLGPHHVKGILSAITKDADWDAYMRSGASIGGLFEGGSKETVQSLSGQRTPLQKLGKTITAPRDLLQYVNSILEQGTRIGVYTQRSGLRQGPSLPGPLKGMIGEPPISPARAAVASRRGPGVDFATRNSGRWIRAMNPVILFLSARMGGAANITEPLIQRGGAARARAMGRLALLGTAAASAYAWNREQKGSEGQSLYQDIPRYERDNNIVIITGTGKTETGKEVPAYIRIPKGDAQKVAWNAIEDGLQWAEGTNQRGVDEALSSLLGNTIPVTDVEGLLPPVVDTALEIGNDVDFFRNRPIEGPELKRLPVTDRVREGTTESAKALARVTGDKFSPVQIDHMINNLFGGAGRALTRGADTVGRVAGVFPQADKQPSAAVQAGRTPLVAGVFGARGGELDNEAYQGIDKQRAQLTNELLRDIVNDPAFKALSSTEQQAIRQRVANRVNAQFADDRKLVAR